MLDTSRSIDAITAEMRVEEAARIALNSRLTNVARFLPAAALDAHHDIEHVHRLRVSTRRALAALRQFEPLTPKRTSRKLTKLLKRIRRAAGQARDLDVLLERVDVQGAHGERLRKRLRKQRRAAQQPIRQLYEELNANDQLGKLSIKLVTGLRTNVCGSGSYETWATRQIRDATDRFFATSASCTGWGSTGRKKTDNDPSQLHRFRLAAKRLRYDLELLTPPLHGKKWPKSIKAIAHLQELLGAVNDHVVGVRNAKKWIAAEPKCKGANRQKKRRRDLRRMLANEKRERKSSLARFRNWWTDQRVGKLRARFDRQLEVLNSSAEGCQRHKKRTLAG